MLLNKVTEWAKRQSSCKVLYLHVIEYNKSAMDFYVRMGFTRFARVEDFYPISGESHAALVYLVYLNDGKPPPPEPPGLLETMWDWLSNTIDSIASLAFGSDEDGEEELVAEAEEGEAEIDKAGTLV